MILSADGVLTALRERKRHPPKHCPPNSHAIFSRTVFGTSACCGFERQSGASASRGIRSDILANGRKFLSDRQPVKRHGVSVAEIEQAMIRSLRFIAQATKTTADDGDSGAGNGASTLPICRRLDRVAPA
jgi:hypothetical protein